jgi:hypothetical protein
MKILLFMLSLVPLVISSLFFQISLGCFKDKKYLPATSAFFMSALGAFLFFRLAITALSRP